MLNENQIGQGGQKPERCAISGRTLYPEDIYFKINGRYLGVKPREWRQLSDTEQAAMHAQWGSEVPGEAAPGIVTSPDYEALSLEELKALAKERDVEIKGRKTVEEVAQALRVADVSARFAPAPAESGTEFPLDLSMVKGG